MKLHPVSLIFIGACVGPLSAMWLHMIIANKIRWREEYHSIIPFIIGFCVALPIGIWLVKKLFSGWKRFIARIVVFTLFLAPVPFGPEGSLFPALVSFLYPPLLLDSWPTIMLSFLCILSVGLLISGVNALLRPEHRIGAGG
jgi:hypothetical protein